MSTSVLHSCVIRPSDVPGTVDLKSVADGWLGRAEADRVAARLLGDSGVGADRTIGRSHPSGRDRPALDRDVMGSWRRHGWHPSDDYYLVSRACSYADERDLDGTVRSSTLGDYARSGPPPARYQPASTGRALSAPAALPEWQSVGEVLFGRMTVRRFDVTQPPAEDELSAVLWHGLAGVRGERDRESGVLENLVAHSHGCAMLPFVVNFNVAGLASGVWFYDVSTHNLHPVASGDFRQEWCRLLQGMAAPMTAGFTLVLVSDFPVYQWRYRHEHALRRLYVESGFIAQQLLVIAEAFDIATLVTPAQKDTETLDLFRLAGAYERFGVIYTLTMGRKPGGLRHS